MTAQRIRAITTFCIALLALASVAVVAAPAAPAAPRGRDTNTIAVVVPKRVKQHKQYHISISGLALHKAKAYLFVDYGRCAATSAAETRIAVGEGVDYTVAGQFLETSLWKTSLVEPGARLQSDHACAYLVNPRTGRVLAVAKATFVVH
jgi:hypothetical protein